MTLTGQQAIRSFVAIELPPEVRGALANAQATLRPHAQGVRWVAPDGIHLTLRFLGSIPTAMVPRVAAALAPSQEVAPFALSLSPAGAFPNWRAPRVIWLGLAGDIQALSGLQRRVEEALQPLGFPPESRPFSAHLTLGRVRDGVRPESLRALAQAAQTMKVGPLSFRVDGLTLFQSTLTPSGARYTALARVVLGGR